MPDPAPDFGSRTDFYTFAPETLAAELPDFEIVREVGKGSMGIVYEARRRADGKRVALKVLPPSLTLTGLCSGNARSPYSTCVANCSLAWAADACSFRSLP